jgi:hypothetical protein
VVSLAARVLASVPDRAPVLLAALAVACSLAVQVGQFRPWVVLPLAVVLVALSWRWVPPAPTGRAEVWSAGVMLLLVAVWCVVGVRHAAEYVVVNRDPGFLTLRALWLVDHPSALIPVGGAAAVDAAVPAASAGTEAFWLQDGLLHAQGNTMLPGLLAVPGWIGGERAVLAGGVGIGAVSLLAVHAVTRRVAGPGWALVPTTALALSLPFLTFTRAAYTEPLTVVLLAAGLAVGYAGSSSGVPRTGTAVLTGALVGATGAARIDGAVVVAGLAAGLLLAGAVVPPGTTRRRAARAGVAALAAATAMTVLGVVDVVRLSPEYAATHARELTALLGLTGVVVLIAGVVLLAPQPLLPDAWRRAAARHARPLGAGAAGAVVLAGVVLATRPLWWGGRAIEDGSGASFAVQVLQQAAGQALDGTRSYDEQTVTWVAWYLGVPAVVLGVAGLALLAHLAVARRDAAATLLLAVVGVAAVFPLVRASITPDQIWAVRRLLPATFPGLLVAGGFALAVLAGRGAARWRRALAGALALAVVAFPLTTWRPGASVVELSGRATQAHAVCDALDDLGVERVVWTHSSPFRYLATLRVVCDVEVVELLEPPSTTDLAEIRRAWGDEPVAALSFDVTDYPWTAVPSTSVGGTASTTLGRTLVGVPRTVDTTWSEVWVGLVEPDGSVSPAVVQPAG